MSVTLMGKVWRTDLPTPEKMVLLVIADHANDDGTNAWPGIATIARKTSISERSVQRHLKTLEDANLITIIKQGGGNKHTRNDRRPNRYDVNLKALKAITWVDPEDDHGVTNGAPADLHGVTDQRHGVTSESARGDKQSVTGCQTERHGVTPVSPYPSLEPSFVEPSLEPSRENTHARDMTEDSLAVVVAEIVPDDDFAHFWSTYPRKESKRKAEQAWSKLKRADRLAALDALSAHVERWRHERTEAKFIPHPPTWLHQRRWEDQLPEPQAQTLGLSKAAQTIQEMMKHATNGRTQDRGLPGRSLQRVE
jgi:DNA-binding transcriptional ArsR family regulator